MSVPISAATALALAGLAATMQVSAAAWAGEIVPHRALYSMNLERAQSSSGLVGATGTLSYQWGDTCDGWNIEQNYKLLMQYQEDAPVAIESNFVTWESKDGKSYRFNEREMRNGDVSDQIRGEASLKGAHGGLAKFTRTKPQDFVLPPGTVFPTAHTLALIREGEAGHRFYQTHVFDGSTEEGSSTVSAVIAPVMRPALTAAGLDLRSPLLDRPSWEMWLSYYSDATKDAQPDYEISMRLLDNGVSSQMTIDYGDYVLKAELLKIEALPKTAC